MPIGRYEIRNEYSLADPDLYRAADTDDPEAVLEGVAMAGLVGVLRQLGDLAEFAADIFHNLHEEVMATAARGHGLMIRAQQLETEIPEIERAFLAQTDHSPFFKYTGVDWHPNLRIDQNLITQGDLPRLVMDSYEECRPPPRLFLLDKFDVAGAGACLKRYSDPSFFKVENSGMTSADAVPREKKNRKAKMKGPRWKNGETTEVLHTSHTKLHQLFMEEARIENGGSNPTRVNFKRKLNGFPFNRKNGESYMEKFLKSTSPDNKVVHEVTANPPPLVSATFNYRESGLEVVEVRPVSPHRENAGRKRSPPSFSDKEKIMVTSSIDGTIREAPNLYRSITTNVDISSTQNEKIIAMDSYREGSLTGYQSDEIVSEVDSYVDATSTVESDMEADSRLRVKRDFTSSHVKSDSLISDSTDENLQIRSFDSQSTRDSTISDEGNNSSEKGMSSFSSHSPTNSVENPQIEIVSTRGFSSAIVDDFPVDDKHSEPVVSTDTCTNSNTDAITKQKSEYEQATFDSRVMGKGMLEGTNSGKSESTLNDENKSSNLVMNLPCFPSVSDAELHLEDGSQKFYAGKHLVGEPIGDKNSNVTNIHSHMTDDSLDKVTSDLLHWDESDREDQNSVGNDASEYNLLNVHFRDTNVTSSEINSSKHLIPGQLDNEFQKVPKNFPSDYPGILHNGDNVIKSKILEEEKLIKGLDNSDSGVSTDSPNRFTCFVDTFLKKKLEETSPAGAQTIDAEDNHTDRSINNQISSDDLVFSHLELSPDWLWTGRDTHERGVFPEEDKTVNGAFVPGTRTGITHLVSPDDPEAQESLCSTTRELKEPPGREPVKMDGTKSLNDVHIADKIFAVPALSDNASTGREVTEKFDSDDLISLNEVHILLDESDKSTGTEMVTTMPALYDNLILDDIPSQIGPTKLVEEESYSFKNSGLDELDNGNNSLPKSHGEWSLTEKVDQTKAATSGFENNDHPESEVSGSTVPISLVDVETADQGLESARPEKTQPPVWKSLLNGEHEISQQSSLGNYASDPPSLPVADYEVEESIGLAETGLHSREISPEDPPGLPIINNQQMPDPLCSIVPPSNPLSGTNLADLTPLPPLPPAQWVMMGKLQLGSSSPFPQLISQSAGPTDDDDASSRFCPLTASSTDDRLETTHSPIQTANEPTTKEKLQLGLVSTEGNLIKHNEVFPQLVSSLIASTDEMKNSPIQIPDNPASKDENAKSSHGEVNSMQEEEPTMEEEKAESSHVEVSPMHKDEPTMEEEKAESSHVEVSPMHEDEPALKEEKAGSSRVKVSPMHEDEPALKEEKAESSRVEVSPMHEDEPALKGEKAESSRVEVSPMHETVDLQPKSESNKQPAMPTEEDGVANGSRVVKLPRPRHPLIDEFTALDKSKLRKVTERFRPPQVQKVNERDSILEQIRTKSFNLKPALAPRPSIRGPSTNLKVAAIVEKAKKIRQAWAGSDEDDDDSWSDS